MSIVNLTRQSHLSLCQWEIRRPSALRVHFVVGTSRCHASPRRPQRPDPAKLIKSPIASENGTEFWTPFWLPKPRLPSVLHLIRDSTSRAQPSAPGDLSASLFADADTREFPTQAHDRCRERTQRVCPCE